ncbi:serine/threonine-protein phosphatase [Bacillus sp. BRMEA1]|uniref:PP2C family protein-serine/threonine phosphatase n=1 Tax=Neobacillus endophyticus TaxID=2738405 RepID=UPI001566DCB0|nr:PP2C family protein-serine/threonine phosphatase [Neobacillus endophyticus]NRD76885.1 serine/threonine-protein phosphatase [Neobacillus endophyticus]
MLKREINLARNIQTKLLNAEIPKLVESELTGTSIPARLIGGDYFDFYPLTDGRIRMVIGDVMGKGIPAAMLMILTRGAFRSAAQSTGGPGDTLTAMNNALYKDFRALRSFVTVLCADWDPKQGTLTFANAGHPLPLLLGGNQVSELPKVSGVMLGGLPNQIYEEKQVRLAPNQYVLFYTDGIIEAQNQAGEQFTRERLKKILLENEGKSVQQLEQAVVQSVYQFSNGMNQKDDITMVLLRI